ncbi:hypothetical protein NLJ89_g1386 [Agrocybe chaxingu]|uniref:Uncharacterized protein n=1 Tax=Agrocybe chaxingu TaxID=84603 RepID=A0A9W8N049_9AGAR|nr:hypothetical protein NLJ89_g1386 [Agrocybe chaxingu]
MANLIISAKSGRGWALKELVYFKIEIETVPALDFFKTAQLPAPTVPAAIMNNVDLPAGPLPHDARLFFGYLEDAMTGEESMVVDFSAFLLRLLAFDEPDRLIHCRKELSFEMCGSHVDAKADVCVVSQVGHHYFFLVQEDKRSIDAEPQLIAETIAAVYQNNRSRIVAGLPTLQQMVIPGITMRGATPIFFKIPITQDLETSAQPY